MKTYSSNWIFPEYINSDIKNESLKIIIDITDDTTYTFRQSGFYVTQGEHIGIIKDDNINIFTVRNINLLRILQDRKTPNEEILPGTYKLMEPDFGIYEIIPEDTYECMMKTKISKIFYDKKIPFTKKMIPGHIYVSKYKRVFICIGSDLDFYSKEIDTNTGMYSRLLRYSDVPKKVKVLIQMDINNDRKFKTIQELAISKLNHYGIIYDNSYAGKDLGPYLKDDGRPFEDYMIGYQNLFSHWFFINELYKHDPDFHDILRENSFCVNNINEIINYNPKTKIIYDL